MGKINLFKKEDNKKITFPQCKSPRGYDENRLVPIHLSGVVIPWEQKLNSGANSDYKLVCPSGLEYYFVLDENWSSVLSWYSWKEVKVVGLLNTSDLILIPQKIYPKGPNGERERVIDLIRWKSQTYKFIKNLNDLVIIPVAAMAI